MLKAAAGQWHNGPITVQLLRPPLCIGAANNVTIKLLARCIFNAFALSNRLRAAIIRIQTTMMNENYSTPFFCRSVQFNSVKSIYLCQMNSRKFASILQRENCTFALKRSSCTIWNCNILFFILSYPIQQRL